MNKQQLNEIEKLKRKGNIPKHIAIIMDGNGRWATKKGLPRVVGHKKGVETVRKIVESCANLGVRYLTLYTFSTENWNRPHYEVSVLMRLIVKSLQTETNELHANNIKLTFIGDTSSLPRIVQKELNEAVEKTKYNDKMVLNLALSYSGRWELIEAIKNISAQYKNNIIELKDINEILVSNNLTTKGIPDPDLLIRSGGEFRISNFLLWQIAYSEIYITDVLWPAFNISNLIDALKDFQSRERRFGRVSQQINRKKKFSKS
ncbi:MAG: isoprenyl transferase [Ignavibacteriales bacterium]|nr:isoprenyl transferase [Ignavibacteriales bacterium]